MSDLRKRNQDWVEGADHGFRHAVELARRLILGNGIHVLAEMDLRRTVADQLYVTMLNRVAPRESPPAPALRSVPSLHELDPEALRENGEDWPGWDANGSPDVG